jgi:hypothetical protein
MQYNFSFASPENWIAGRLLADLDIAELYWPSRRYYVQGLFKFPSIIS